MKIVDQGGVVWKIADEAASDRFTCDMQPMVMLVLFRHPTYWFQVWQAFHT